MKKLILPWLASLLFLSVAHAAVEDELLEPDQAFQIKASAKDAATALVEWTIADGYYMYRNKLRFQSNTPGITLGIPNTPAGTLKHDEFFGEVETYRQHISVEIPIERAAGSPNAFEITATSQGCADQGVCYPPHTQKVRVELPTAAPAATQNRNGILAGLAKLGAGLGLGGGAQDEFLDPDQAFAFSATTQDADTLVARWKIADSYYLYRNKFAFELKGADGVSLGSAQLPAGKVKEDEYFGRQEIYYHEVEARLPLQRGASAPASLTLQATYQGCAEAGICYPPIVKTVSVALPAAPAAAATAQAALPPVPQAPLSEQDQIASRLASSGTLLTILTFFGFGLLLSLTPCVFPMIPILSGIIVGQGEELTARKGFTLSLVYVLAMSLTYTVAGVLAGLFGGNLQATFQNPWILGSFAGVFALLSLSMFGFYELQMPSSLQSRLAEISNRQQGGTLAGVGVMGFLSALIVGPCVAPPLAGALIYIGQTGNAVLGGIALFALSMGMGAPLLAIGTSAGKLLPKVGPWMNIIKAVFGVLMLAVAIWMLERVLPGPVTLLLWAVLLIVSAIYMGALEQLGPDATGWRKLWKGVGLVMLIYGALLTVGAAGGNKDMFQPLRGVGLVATSAGGGTAAPTETLFKRIKGMAELERELAAATSTGRPVMFDLYADWCVSCKELEKYTFADPSVQQTLAKAVLLQSDVTAWDKTDQELAKAHGLIGPPAILFFGPDGKERRNYRVVGFMTAEQFRAHAERALQ